MQRRAERSWSVVALLFTALASGALAGLAAACFIWVIEEGTHLVWVELPDRVGVDPFGSWWLFAILIAGGALVGLGQQFLGDHPKPLAHVVRTWRSGGQVDPRSIVPTIANSASALISGGPLGFEAALTGLLAGMATWIGGRIDAVGHLVRQAWGAEAPASLPDAARRLPYWIAAISGLFVFRWLPFGQLDFGFRFEREAVAPGVGGALELFCFAAIVTVPFAWVVSLVPKAEGAVLFRRSPILIGMAGGLVVATLAVGNEYVLFSGQQGIQHLVELGDGALLYLSVTRVAALVVALLAGWRGGPVFPLYVSIASLAIVVDGILDVGPDLVMVAGIAALGVVFLKGSIPMAFVLTLYVAPFSYTGIILIGALGAATALAVADSLGVLPRPPDD